MRAAKVSLVNTRATYLTTLYGKALDAAARSPILGDIYAAQAVERIDFDFRKLKMPSGGNISLPLRAKHFDGWTREFLAAHPRATVLHLGCGLDSRVFRIDPQPGVSWFDVDVPEVIALRRQLYPERAGYELLAASVTDANALEQVPRDQPVLVVAEGLVMYLPEPSGVALLQRISGGFIGGQIVFDAYGSLTTRVITLASKLSPTPVRLPWGINDPHSIERKVPALRLLDAVPFLTMPELVERLGVSRIQRAGSKLIKAVPMLRNSILHLRYGFDNQC